MARTSIYYTAALNIAEGQEDYSCNAVKHVSGRNNIGKSKAIKNRLKAEAVQKYIDHFKLEESHNSIMVYSFGEPELQEARDLRVMALLFMHEMSK